MTKRKNRRQNRQSQRRQFRRKVPPLRLTPYAWAKLLHLRDLGETEVGGFGVAAPGDLLLVADVVLVRQQCSPVTVKFDDGAVADYFDRQVDADRTPEQFGRIWIHTHPGDCPLPSCTDEATFERCFGSADWAVMFIVARGGQTYARLRFNSGPQGELLLPVEIDFQEPFGASDWAAWEEEYCEAVISERDVLSAPERVLTQTALIPRERWPDDFGLLRDDPFFDPFYAPEFLERIDG
jgi:hypothetical protein